MEESSEAFRSLQPFEVEGIFAFIKMTLKMQVVFLLLFISGCSASRNTTIENNGLTINDELTKRIENEYGKGYTVDQSAKLLDIERAIQQHLVYPNRAVENRIEGQVVLAFLINKDGFSSDINVIRGLGYDCTKAAITALKKVKFESAIYQDNPGNIVEVVPIVFRLNKY